MNEIDEEIDTLQTECCDHCLIGSYDVMNLQTEDLRLVNRKSSVILMQILKQKRKRELKLSIFLSNLIFCI